MPARRFIHIRKDSRQGLHVAEARKVQGEAPFSKWPEGGHPSGLSLLGNALWIDLIRLLKQELLLLDLGL